MLRRLPFKTKIILAQNVIILFVAILLSSVFYHRTLLAVSERALDDFKMVSDSIANQMDNHFYMMDSTALQIAANPNIVNEFRRLIGSSDTNYFAEEPLKNAAFVELLNSYNFKKDGFKRICLYNQYQDFVYTATDVTTSAGIEQWFLSDSFKEIQTYFENDSHHVSYMWLGEDVLNGTGIKVRPFFSVIRQIKNYITNEKVYAYVEVQENVEWLERLADSIDNDICVALFHGDTAVYKNTAATGAEIVENIRAMENSGAIKAGVASEISGQFTYVKKLNNAPYQMVFVKEPGQALAIFSQYNIAILISLILIVGIAVTTEIFIIRKLSKPLEQLNRFVESMTPDEPQLEVGQLENNDEFVRIQSAFDVMVRRVKEAIEREYASEANGLKAQLFALQSQMNPHFLYNILAIISTEAEANENDRIPNMCVRLRRMLDYSSHMGNGYSTIKKEVEYVLDYMELMKVRYEDAFHYLINVDEKLYGTKIPKFIIQPLCENSFKHSFKKMEPTWKTTVMVYEVGNKWMIEIHDNGVGFSEEYLEAFSKKARDFSIHQTQNHLESGTVEGMGIWNIYMRMMICYENEFVFQLFNDGEGAVVLIGGERR